MSFLQVIALILTLSSLGHCSSLWTERSRNLANEATSTAFLKLTLNNTIKITDDNGNLVKPFLLPKTEIETKINQYKTDSTDVLVFDEDVNYFTLQINPSAVSPRKIKVTSNTNLGVRLAKFKAELYELSAATFSNAVDSIFYPDSQTASQLYVQFLCRDNASHPVTIQYAITEDANYTFNTAAAKTFTLVKKCKLGKKTDLVFRVIENEKDLTENKIFNVSDLTKESNTKLVFSAAGPIIQIRTESYFDQPIAGLTVTNLTPELKVEFVGHPPGGLINKTNLKFGVPVKIKCLVPPKEHVKDYLVPFELQFHVPPYETVKALMYADCNKVQNFNRSFPLSIGTAPGLKDVIDKGNAKEAYHANERARSYNNLKKIYPEIGATEFFIFSDFSSVSDKANYTLEVVFDKIVITTDEGRLKAELVEIPSTNFKVTEDLQRFVLEFNCIMTGEHLVTVTFNGVKEKPYQYDFSVIKQCLVSEYRHVRPSKILHYLLIVVAIGFGFYLIGIFKRMLVKEKSKHVTPQQLNSFNFRGTQMTSRTMAPLDDSLETDVRDF